MNDVTITKSARLYDEAKDVWFDVYIAPGIEGNTIKALVPREEQKLEAVRRQLLRKGAALPNSTNYDEKLREVIASEPPTVRRAAITGWRDRNRIFVSHLGVVGTAAGNRFVPPDCDVASVANLASRGDLQSWQKLAGIARCSTAMTVSLCAAFAAPLLTLLRQPSFALVLVGPSRSGKSTAQLLAASTIGFGEERELPNMNSTRAGLLATALSYCGHVLPINEVGTANAAKHEVYDVLRDTTYALVNGQDIIRHPSWEGAIGGSVSSFEVLPLLSSEISPDEWAARSGNSRDPGEMARLIGLPVIFGDTSSVFDRPPKNLIGNRLDWETNQFRALRQGLPAARGVAFQEYIKALVAKRRRYKLEARKIMRVFRTGMCKVDNLNPVARDIVGKFALLKAGGVIAVRAGVLPLDEKELGQAVKRACRVALAALPDHEADLRADIVTIKSKLAGSSIIDMEECTGKQRRLMQQSDGYRQYRDDGSEFVIRAQILADWVPQPARLRRLLEWLDDRGILDHDRPRSAKRSNEWAQKQVTWPNKTRARSIVLFMPGGLSDLDR